MNKKTIGLILALVLLFVGYQLFTNETKSQIREAEVEKETKMEELKSIVLSFVGKPYELGPLGEGEDEELYREDVFDCTTLVLVSVSKLHSENPEEMIKEINYYPPGEVSYENRLHFSSYRNKVSEYFEDITPQVAGQYTKSKSIVLNKTGLIDIDWQEEVTLNYVSKSDAGEVLGNLPEVAGVMFVKDGDEDMGLDVRHEGFIINNEDLVHASSDHRKVRRESFLNYLQNSSYDGVSFYKIK